MRSSISEAANIYQFLAALHDFITGNAYSVDEREQLRQLRITYSQQLRLDEKDIPSFFTLDANNKPKCVEAPVMPAATISESFFARYADHCILGIQNYIDVRRDRTFRSGKKGDLVQLFFFELLMYLSRLRTAVVSESEVNNLGLRLNYLHAMRFQQNSPLDFGIFSDDRRSAQAVLVRTHEELEIALERSKEELKKQDANQRLEKLYTNTGNFLDQVLDALFGFVYSTIDPAINYYDGAMAHFHRYQQSGKSELPVLYRDFPIEKGLGRLIYNLWQKRFEPSYVPRKIALTEIEKLGFPEIFNNEQKRRGLQHLLQIQDLFFELDELHHLLQSAKTMAGIRGNLWAYGPVGGLVLQRLLESLRERLNNFSVLAKDFKEMTSSAMSQYKMTKHVGNEHPYVSSAMGFMKNLEALSSSMELISREAQDVLTKRADWPSNADEQAQAVERDFFRRANDYFAKSGQAPLQVQVGDAAPSDNVEALEEKAVTNEAIYLWDNSGVVPQRVVVFSDVAEMKERWYHAPFSKTAKFNRLRRELIDSQSKGELRRRLLELEQSLESRALTTESQQTIFSRFSQWYLEQKKAIARIDKQKPRWGLFSLGRPFNSSVRRKLDEVKLNAEQEIQRVRENVLAKVNQVQAHALIWDFSDISTETLDQLLGSQEKRQELMAKNGLSERLFQFLFCAQVTAARWDIVLMAFQQRFSDELYDRICEIISARVDQIALNLARNSLEADERNFLANLLKVVNVLPFESPVVFQSKIELLVQATSLQVYLEQILSRNLKIGDLSFYCRGIPEDNLRKAAALVFTKLLSAALLGHISKDDLSRLKALVRQDVAVLLLPDYWSESVANFNSILLNSDPESTERMLGLENKKLDIRNAEFDLVDFVTRYKLVEFFCFSRGLDVDPQVKQEYERAVNRTADDCLAVNWQGMDKTNRFALLQLVDLLLSHVKNTQKNEALKSLKLAISNASPLSLAERTKQQAEQVDALIARGDRAAAENQAKMMAADRRLAEQRSVSELRSQGVFNGSSASVGETHDRSASVARVGASH